MNDYKFVNIKFDNLWFKIKRWIEVYILDVIEVFGNRWFGEIKNYIVDSETVK